MKPTEQELRILEIIREVKPFEVIQISRDKGGKKNTYFIVRTQKLLIGEGVNEAVKPISD